MCFPHPYVFNCENTLYLGILTYGRYEIGRIIQYIFEKRSEKEREDKEREERKHWVKT
jgi:hypothetical protein